MKYYVTDTMACVCHFVNEVEADTAQEAICSPQQRGVLAAGGDNR